MADWSWVKPVGEFVVNLFGSISKSSKEKKDKKQAETMAQSNQVPAGQYLGVDGILYPTNHPGNTKKDLERKQSHFGGSIDWSKFESSGRNAEGEELFRPKIKVAAMPNQVKDSNIVPGGGFFDQVLNMFGGNSSSGGANNPSPVKNVVGQIFKPVNLMLIGGAGYGIWYYFNKAKKPVR